MFGLLFKLFGVAIALLLIAFSAANAFRNARRLDRRIQDFKAEQEALRQKGKTIDPFAGMAELYADDVQRAAKEEARRSARARR